MGRWQGDDGVFNDGRWRGYDGEQEENEEGNRCVSAAERVLLKPHPTIGNEPCSVRCTQ
jgi:hypothetical protein